VESIGSLVLFSSLQCLQGEQAEILPKQPTGLHQYPQNIIQSNTLKQLLQSKQDGEAEDSDPFLKLRHQEVEVVSERSKRKRDLVHKTFQIIQSECCLKDFERSSH